MSVILFRPRCKLTHRSRDKMAAIFLTTFPNAFLWKKSFVFIIKLSLRFIRKCPINNIPALVQIMAWRRPGDKLLSEPMMVSLLTHICVTRPRCINSLNVYPWRVVRFCGDSRILTLRIFISTWSLQPIPAAAHDDVTALLRCWIATGYFCSADIKQNMSIYVFLDR